MPKHILWLWKSHLSYFFSTTLPGKYNQPFAFKSTKWLFFLSNLGKFSVDKFEKSNFLAKTWIEYFHIGIFVILGVYAIKKYGCQTQNFFSVFQCFLDHRVSLWRVVFNKHSGNIGTLFFWRYFMFKDYIWHYKVNFLKCLGNLISLTKATTV